ncbi:MAG TPA: diphosphomevalonate decarboxylase [Spirochaetia bacterium]|nr:diphosphomevalonate decarboxylase [Spirochaetia bacterium]
MKGHAVAGPSLALIKYWGKKSTTENTPATGSLAVTLAGLESRTEASFDDRDSVVVDGEDQPPARFAPFLDSLRQALELGNQGIAIVSQNNFPTAAGLASSSSGFAALAGAVAALAGASLPAARLSALARLGSGSATRSIYGGFTVFDAGAEAAVPERDEGFWPDFRVLLCVVREGAKATSSRRAMESSRTTSPYYDRWVESSPALLTLARRAVADRSWNALGPLVRQSYLRMFGTMFSAEPPLLYWKPESLALIGALEDLRHEGLTAWETMDAGPQVKVFCPAGQADTLVSELDRRVPGLRFLTAAPGPGLRTWRTE